MLVALKTRGYRVKVRGKCFKRDLRGSLFLKKERSYLELVARGGEIRYSHHLDRHLNSNACKDTCQMQGNAINVNGQKCQQCALEFYDFLSKKC